MAEKCKLRGFTRADALVAGVACLVLILLVPVLLGKPRERSIRMICAANLAQIGKTMFLYAKDNEDALPRAGGPTTTWGPLANWTAVSHQQAFGLEADGSGGKATINASFFLLVKYYQVPTRLFLCRGDKGTTEFKRSDVSLPWHVALSDAWDFGPLPVAFKSCSFSYHLPYSQYALTTSRDPNLAVAADRNPWFKSPAGDPVPFIEFKPGLPQFGGVSEQARTGNAFAHGKDGQNVLFLDGRVTFETRAYCGVYQDNIYTISGLPTGGSPIGQAPTIDQKPANGGDSFLVHDPPAFSGGSSSKP